MSNTDSFIEEVSEEVRRDKLFAQFKRWGWLVGLVLVLVIGGAAFSEWRKAENKRVAGSFGDALLAQFDDAYSGQPLDGINAQTPGQAAVAGHLAAAKALADGDSEAGLAELDRISALDDADPIYRQLAEFKAALALPLDNDPGERIAAFDAIAGPFRVLAQEQKAMVLIEQGERAAAADLLRQLLQSAEATPGLQRRASEVMIALGVDLTGNTSEQNDSDG